MSENVNEKYNATSINPDDDNDEECELNEGCIQVNDDENEETMKLQIK